MEAITIESLLTVTGVALVIGILLQGIKVAFSEISSQWLRRVALGLGIVLMLVATWSSGPEGNLILLYLVAAVNGVIAGLAAGAAFDTVKYGDSRIVTHGS